MFKSKLPHIELDSFNTPIQHLKQYGKLLNHKKIYMKRDDLNLIGLGGNKLRKLEFWLGEALYKGCDIVLVAGGINSNLVRLTAAACTKLEVPCLAIHNSEKAKSLQGNSLLNTLFKAETVYLGDISEEERNKKVNEIEETLISKGHNPYVINKEFIGTVGYAECAEEIYKQNSEMDLGIKHIVIVGAMAFTASGFIYGNAMLNNYFTTHVISVEYEQKVLDRLIEDKINNLCKLTSESPNCNYKDKTYTYDKYMGEGWSIPTEDSMQQIFNLAKTEAIVVDHVYNAKVLAGLKSLINKNIIKKDEAVCVVHTGGTPSVFNYSELITDYIK